MNQTIKIEIPEETRAAIDEAMREEGISRKELIEKALKDYLFIRRFRNLRERMMSESSEAYSDQDIFEQVS